MNVDAAKTQLGRVFDHEVDSDDLAGFLYLDPQNFERLVQLVTIRSGSTATFAIRGTRSGFAPRSPG